MLPSLLPRTPHRTQCNHVLADFRTKHRDFPRLDRNLSVGMTFAKLLIHQHTIEVVDEFTKQEQQRKIK